MEEEFILIGWLNNFNNPIIVPKNVSWNSRECELNMFRYLRGADSGGSKIYIILSQLYKLENIRNLDLYGDLLQVANTLLIDNNCNTILNGIGYTSSHVLFENLNANNTQKDNYYRINRNAILEIEQNYPGLFRPIYGPAPGPLGPAPAPFGGKKHTKKRQTKRRK